VHLRLQADLKWFDITDDDLRAWVRELHPDGYRRQRSNLNAFIAKFERLRGMMDEAASHWQNLPPEEESESDTD
jgi:CBS-domain-containing membrane protein